MSRSAEDMEGGRESSPHPVDRHVGLRLRIRRRELGLSQERLAEIVGLTFQQVQKYERAANRVSASKLLDLARALKVQPSYFFEGLPETEDAGAAAAGSAGWSARITPEFTELAQHFPKLTSPQRRRLLELVRTLATDTELADPGGEGPAL